MYMQTEWLIRKADAPHAARSLDGEVRAKIGPAFRAEHLANAVKIVGVSDEYRLDLDVGVVRDYRPAVLRQNGR